jgi:transcriptional regulator with XRE-family HTH domain
MNRHLTFGQVIKGFRKTHGWTQEQLGSITKLSERTIQRIENDEHPPSDTTIMALANAFENSFEFMKELATGYPLKAGQSILSNT